MREIWLASLSLTISYEWKWFLSCNFLYVRLVLSIMSVKIVDWYFYTWSLKCNPQWSQNLSYPSRKKWTEWQWLNAPITVTLSYFNIVTSKFWKRKLSLIRKMFQGLHETIRFRETSFCDCYSSKNVGVDPTYWHHITDIPLNSKF